MSSFILSEQKETKVEQTPKMIQSTIDGGDWNNPETWHGGIVPDKQYDVSIAGRVIIADKAECLNLMVDIDGYLEVKQNAVLNIYHHVVIPKLFALISLILVPEPYLLYLRYL